MANDTGFSSSHVEYAKNNMENKDHKRICRKKIVEEKMIKQN
jgi:hypothetical protein